MSKPVEKVARKNSLKDYEEDTRWKTHFLGLKIITLLQLYTVKLYIFSGIWTEKFFSLHKPQIPKDYNTTTLKSYSALQYSLQDGWFGLITDAVELVVLLALSCPVTQTAQVFTEFRSWGLYHCEHSALKPVHVA